jgi:uncharacterized protein (DUF427 family)
VLLYGSAARITAIAPGPVETGVPNRFTATAERKAALAAARPRQPPEILALSKCRATRLVEADECLSPLGKTCGAPLPFEAIFDWRGEPLGPGGTESTSRTSGLLRAYVAPGARPDRPRAGSGSDNQRGEAMEEKISPRSKPIKEPGPDHPITIERNPNRLRISVAGRVVVDTREALTLREATYPAVQYIPRKDVDMTLLERTNHATYCPYKGDCTYFSIPLGGKRSINAVWTYEDPYAAVLPIKEHLAFYPDRVDALEEHPES